MVSSYTKNKNGWIQFVNIIFFFCIDKIKSTERIWKLTRSTKKMNLSKNQKKIHHCRCPKFPIRIAQIWGRNPFLNSFSTFRMDACWTRQRDYHFRWKSTILFSLLFVFKSFVHGRLKTMGRSEIRYGSIKIS